MSTKKYLAAFRQFDKDDSGTISIEEFRILLEDTEEFTAEDIDKMLKDMDKDNDGTIDYEGKLLNKSIQYQNIIL